MRDPLRHDPLTRDPPIRDSLTRDPPIRDSLSRDPLTRVPLMRDRRVHDPRVRHSRMGRSLVSRLANALLGLWVTVTLVVPNGLSGMMMGGSSAPLTASVAGTSKGSSTMSPATMNSPMMSSPMMSSPMMAGMHHGANGAATASAGEAEHVAHTQSLDGAPAQSPAPEECHEHECCCPAVSVVLRSAEETLSWVPAFVIEQNTPRRGDCVSHTEGQLRLPFANGPPRTVTA